MYIVVHALEIISGRAPPGPSGWAAYSCSRPPSWIFKGRERSIEGMGETGKEQMEEKNEKSTFVPREIPSIVSAVVAPMVCIRLNARMSSSSLFRGRPLYSHFTYQRAVAFDNDRSLMSTVQHG